MNSSGETTGSIEPYCTGGRRRAAARRGDPLGGDDRAALGVPPRLGVLPLHQVLGQLLHRLGSIRATVRANSRLVSTSSAATTQRGGFFASGVPGDDEAGVAGAQVLAARPLVALAMPPGPWPSSACTPTWEERVASRAVDAHRRARRPPSVMPSRGRCRGAGRAGPATRGCAGSAGTRASRCGGTGCRSVPPAARRGSATGSAAPGSRSSRRRTARAAGRRPAGARSAARAGPGWSARRDDQHLVEHAALVGLDHHAAIRGSSGSWPAIGRSG